MLVSGIVFMGCNDRVSKFLHMEIASLSSLFPLGVNDSIHSLFSIMLFIFIEFFELFSTSAIRRIPNRVKLVPYFGFSIAIVNFMLGVSFNFVNFFFWRMDNDWNVHFIHCCIGNISRSREKFQLV